MEQPPRAMLLGDDEGDYYRGTFRKPAADEADAAESGTGAAK
jgi:hypothetical protein